MTIAQPHDKNTLALLLPLLTALLGSMTPAFYATSWTPWARYMLTGCFVLVVLIIVITIVGPLPVLVM